MVRTTQLEREMRTREEQHLMEVESLSGKLKEQEAHVEGRIVNYISLRPHTCSTTSCSANCDCLPHSTDNGVGKIERDK